MHEVIQTAPVCVWHGFSITSHSRIYKNVNSLTAGHNWRLQVPTAHLCILMLDQDWLPNCVWCRRSRGRPSLKSVFSLNTEKRSDFQQWMWKQLCSFKLCTHIILHSEARTFNCRNKKEKHILTGGGRIKVIYPLSVQNPNAWVTKSYLETSQRCTLKW